MKASVLCLLILSCLAWEHVVAHKRHRRRSSPFLTRKKPCLCTTEVDEQCGVDGKTYKNKCKADCKGVDIACPGKCPCKKGPEETCSCTALFDPVCGADGKTYSNAGCAACRNADVACRGTCPCDNLAACSCIREDKPVCGVDDKDYGSPCLARCSGVDVACDGVCPCNKPTDPQSCICQEIYAPVCSTEGKTFGNECEAGCANAKIDCEGECPCKTACAQVACITNPCDGATCPGYPNAKCVADYCGGCNTDFYLDGKIVDCDDKPPACVCPKNLDRVCGSDGKDYGNPCVAECAGAEVACKGKCPCSSECLAPLIKCARNPCDAAKCPAHPDAKCVPDYCKGCDAVDFKINNKIVDCDEPQGCVCTLQYDPVCGVDGKTYGNACAAGCNDVATVCDGECPCEPKCDGVIVQCLVDPCDVEKCPAHPDAECRSNYCNACNAEFFVKGVKVDCEAGPKCSKQGEECEFSYGLLSKYSGSKKECCDGLRCCRCAQDVERGMALYYDNRGTCLERCIQCKG